MGTGKNKSNPYLLFLISTALLTAGWLMKPFPIFIMAGIAPLLAISNLNDHKKNSWNHLELIALALATSFWAGNLFDLTHLTDTLVMAICFALSFLAFHFTQQVFGPRFGKLPVLLFWLAIEYIVLKSPWADRNLFLADSWALKPEWTRWTSLTGYLGISAWVLFSNILFYHGVWHKGFQPVYLVLFALLIAVPIIYSLVLTTNGIDNSMMLAAYSETENKSLPLSYQQKGEWLPRTGAWISVLILVFAMVKNKARK